MSLNNRYDFVLLFDVKDGNPNGDPDAGNLPRVDAETGMGLITDVCLKRKVRNFVGMIKGEQPPYEIYVKEKAILNSQHDRAYEAINKGNEVVEKKGKDNRKVEEARQWMCQNFYDVRAFGAVMSTGNNNCGQVRGPVQLTFARSVDPVMVSDHTITRVAITKVEDAQRKETEMGRKSTIPYGLYRCHGFVSAHLAKQTKFNDSDLELFWQALIHMFDHDRSASRGEMNARGLYVFRHNNELGNAHAHSLFDKIKVAKANDKPARQFNDYLVTVDNSELPDGVELVSKLG